jgi:RimJ/RimL family protein N-acetyltransferase
MDKKIILRSLEQQDLEQAYRWRNQEDILQRTRQFRFLTKREHMRWFTKLNPNKDLMYAIIEQTRPFYADDFSNNIYIGVAGLTNLDWVNRSAEVSIYIGYKNYRRKSYGTKVISELSNICFNQLNFHRLWAEVYDLPNSAIPDFFIKCGFKKDGKIRDVVYRNGQYYDSWIFSMLREECLTFI